MDAILTNPGIGGSSTWMLMLLLKATLILLVALGATISMQQRFSAGARYAVWLVTVVALLLVPALAVWSPLPFRVLPATSHTALAPAVTGPSPATGSEAAPDAGTNAPAIETGTSLDDAPATPGTSEPASLAGLTPLSLAFFLWAVVVLAIASSLGFAALAVRRIVRRADPLDSRDWLAPLWEVSDRLGLDEPPVVLRSEDAKMPFACGVLTPTIVLPAESDTWTLDRRRAVLLHELAHVKRRDLIGHTLGRLACAVYWFHPLVWTAAKRLRSESERACDDLALSCGARATDYAEHLLEIVTSVRRDATPSVALAMARRKEFEGRMLAILDPELKHSSPSRRQTVGLIASLALITMVIGAASPAPRQSETAGDALEVVDSDSQQEIDAEPETKLGKKEESSRSSVAEEWKATEDDADTDVASRAVNRSTLLQMMTQGGTAAKSDERPALLAKILLSDPNAELREIAAWGLHEYSDIPVGADALATALRRDTNVGVREMAAWALHDANGSQPALDALIAALRSDASVQVRATAAWTLGNIGEDGAVEPLTAALSDASPQVRKRAAWAIGHTEPRQAPRALIAMLSDRDPGVRQLVAWALYQIEDPAAIPALDAALRSEQDKNLQIAYIRALAAVGDQSVDALRRLLESNDPEIKKIAVRALAGGNATGPWPWPWPEPRPFPR